MNWIKLNLLVVSMMLVLSALSQGKIVSNQSVKISFEYRDTVTYLQVVNVETCRSDIQVKINRWDTTVNLTFGGRYYDTIYNKIFDVWARNLSLCRGLTVSTTEWLHASSTLDAMNTEIEKSSQAIKRKCDEVIIQPAPDNTTRAKPVH
jgi:hypothetical protein